MAQKSGWKSWQKLIGIKVFYIPQKTFQVPLGLSLLQHQFQMNLEVSGVQMYPLGRMTNVKSPE